MPPLEDVALRRGLPQGTASVRFAEPHEIAAGPRLIRSVNPHGIVRGGAAKVLTPRTLGVIGVGSRIKQEFLSPDRQGEREGVGMAMGGDGLITQGASVCNQPDLVIGFEVTAEDVVAASRKDALALRRGRRFRISAARWRRNAESAPAPKSQRVLSSRPPAFALKSPRRN